MAAAQDMARDSGATHRDNNLPAALANVVDQQDKAAAEKSVAALNYFALFIRLSTLNVKHSLWLQSPYCRIRLPLESKQCCDRTHFPYVKRKNSVKPVKLKE